MDLIKSYLNAGNKQELFIAAIALEGVFTFCFVICSFVVASTANAGFNCVLTGLLNVALVGGSYHVIKTSKAPIAVGFLIGSSAMITILNFMTAIYWGNLSKCEVISDDLAGYSCDNSSAYGAVSAFAVLLFLIQSIITSGLIIFRNELINETGLYDDISTSSTHAPTFPYETPTAPGQFAQPAPSADL